MNQIDLSGVGKPSIKTAPCISLDGSFLEIEMDTKVCSKCGEEKPVAEFFGHKEHKDGLRSECKACTQIYKELYALRYRDKIRFMKRKYYKENRDSILAKKRIYAAGRRKDQLAYERQYRKEHPLRIRAKNEVNRAVHAGKIIRPDHCSGCGCECKPHGHHCLGYEKEHWFDIKWLCVSCHQSLHAKKRMEENDTVRLHSG